MLGKTDANELHWCISDAKRVGVNSLLNKVSKRHRQILKFFKAIFFTTKKFLVLKLADT